MQAASFTIRPVEEADRPVLLGHVLALNRFEDPFAGDRATGQGDAEASLDHLLGRVAESGGVALVAEAEGRPVAHLFVVIETAPPYIRAEFRRRAYVADAFVQEAWRGQGAFRALLASAEIFARTAGCRQMMIGVLAGNDRAEHVYRTAGFRPYALELVREIAPA
ncbi:GNAT family N-acetyltransferase [Falsiroseomonas tokyonensis]|uniref:GNAT family N-acetyltransferase n=1 Tax=Falsiroseomonas tokyonensis TaxID=430521 RepID=A0ABV7BVF8_9PROT|nr:GNAT family N-acetyltransferase [Falsiroseomonas tokyonensis]MBU8538822.1 GNAT family N-acetyltransferase [Falsiroseomonas tokyonensis]